MNSPITTHVLDTTRGKPARGIRISLEKKQRKTWMKLASGKTNADGRIMDLLSPGFNLSVGVYRMKFETSAYFKSMRSKSFYPYIEITFEIEDTAAHYHVPLLLNPFGYSTYRGS